jgi:hypothetical protein
MEQVIEQDGKLIYIRDAVVKALVISGINIDSIQILEFILLLLVIPEAMIAH